MDFLQIWISHVFPLTFLSIVHAFLVDSMCIQSEFPVHAFSKFQSIPMDFLQMSCQFVNVLCVSWIPCTLPVDQPQILCQSSMHDLQIPHELTVCFPWISCGLPIFCEDPVGILGIFHGFPVDHLCIISRSPVFFFIRFLWNPCGFSVGFPCISSGYHSP